MEPFLTIVTRCCHRPQMLQDNIASIKAQTNRNVQQIFIVDQEKSGVHTANKALAVAQTHIRGKYVYILDDDCWLIKNDFVEILRKSTFDSPHLVMVKSLRPPGPPAQGITIFPTKRVWESSIPRHGETNCLCYIVESSLWKAQIDAFGLPAGGDWGFLKALIAQEPTMIWINDVVAESRQLGRGKLFEPTTPRWFERIAGAEKLRRHNKKVWSKQWGT